MSQSGGSPDLVESLTAARECGALTVAVTNNPARPWLAAAEIASMSGPAWNGRSPPPRRYTAELLALTCC